MPTPSQIKSIPVYGVDNYGTDKWIPFIDTLALVGFTQSALDEALRATEGTEIPIDDIPQFISNLNSNAYSDHGTDNEVFDRTYQWRPDMTALVYKITVNLAMVMDMTAWTSNQANFTHIRITITEAPNGKVLYDNTFATGLADQGQVGVSQFVLHADILKPFKVFSAQPISVRVRTLFTQTATNTIRFGMVPFFANTVDSFTKFFSQSGVLFHIHASLDHSIPVWKQDHNLINHVWENVGSIIDKAIIQPIRRLPEFLSRTQTRDRRGKQGRFNI